MAVDLTQFSEGDSIAVELRASVMLDDLGIPVARVGALGGWVDVSLARALSARHIAPVIEPGKYYVDARSNLYVGASSGAILYGPLGTSQPERHMPDDVARIRGLRPATVRPA